MLALRPLALALRAFVLPLRALVLLLLLRALEMGRFFAAARPRVFLLVLRDFVPALRDLERLVLRPRSLVVLRALPVAPFLELALRAFVLRLRDLLAVRALVAGRLAVLRLRPFAFGFVLALRDLERFVL